MSEDVFSAEPEVQDPELARLGAAPGKDLSPAARRALEEAAARREAEAALVLPSEKGGRDGPEPTRFGDWERKGVAVDF
ncbi:DUF1674 domain-containing protein [Caulobacter flavus]|uniref:DUF1674 domain-containing protein n=1 Tax=Caulobacter flavus TaxID=1679497 RepID=A0A2N5D680_9CAUL|nr:DUF1674 domain-containing protein [Caulobacter flavus]AYV45884.1 DUF1674 domain-containing protein [Caulobacter flavus]PLR21574.1 DUF1674 domain-containing protein [Caulobacter flavus]